ncbi:MAG: Mur ligase family protein [bacterium]|nr:Mur ligase family protein [bacterium]
MRTFLESLLAFLARAVVRRQQPLIVGITGSVGKTSAREAIRAVLDADWDVRAAPKNYNNEIGLPVAIIGGRAPGRSPWRWVALLARGKWYAAVRGLRYPEALVLEYGADHPGDLSYLLRIARPHVAVVTAVGAAHTEFFKSVDRVASEKRKLVSVLSRDDIAVLNRDDIHVWAMTERTKARVISYGTHEDADVRGIEYRVTSGAQGVRDKEQGTTGGFVLPGGMTFKIVAGGATVPVHLPGCLGAGHMHAALAAAAVGLGLGMHLVEISHALRQYQPAPGRMRIIPGIKETALLDDSYNASPLAVAVALHALEQRTVPGRAIAVLGDMLELGTLTIQEHERIGRLAAAQSLAYLICVGAASRQTAAAARAAGMPADRILEFSRAQEAGRFVQDLLAPGDVVLIKGSQGVRLERIVRELMADPLRAPALLCRQDRAWTA